MNTYTSEFLGKWIVESLGGVGRATRVFESATVKLKGKNSQLGNYSRSAMLIRRLEATGSIVIYGPSRLIAPVGDIVADVLILDGEQVPRGVYNLRGDPLNPLTINDESKGRLIVGFDTFEEIESSR